MSDKRKVSTDALETLGNIIDKNEKRDAIHLAVEPIRAAQKLFPGQDVGLVDGGAGVCDNPLGIVDPFLKNPIYPGQYFWLIVYPRTIQSLRHVWSHPAFSDAVDTTNNDSNVSKKWMEMLAYQLGVTYDTLMAAAKAFVETNKKEEAFTEYLIGDDMMEGEVTPPEFWEHYEIITGEKVGDLGNFFSCSC